jgi:hypothetical protein
MHLGSHIIDKEPTTDPTAEEQITIHANPRGDRHPARTKMRKRASAVFASNKGRAQVARLTGATKSALRALFEGSTEDSKRGKTSEKDPLVEMELARFKHGARKLEKAHELVMVLPWPLLQRAR